MSNVNASEDNIESPSTYANDAYKEFRKKEKEEQLKTLKNDDRTLGNSSAEFLLKEFSSFRFSNVSGCRK